VRFDFVLQAAASTKESAPQSRLARALS